MADSDLDPQAFLKTVRDLSDKRQREDNERYEKLEAQILQDRTARLERKMERERSLSPEKTPQSVHSRGVRTPLDTGSPNSSLPASPIRELSRGDSVRSFRSDRASSDFVDRPASPTKPASPSAAMPSRTNTMSWQRRPQSGARSRPLSVFAAENASRASTEALTDSRPTSRDEPTQQDIVRSLSTKDPSWFRQTPDRGLGSVAYRRSRDEEEDARPGSDKRQLPGLVSSRTEPTRQSGSLTSGGLTTPTRSSFQRELSPQSEEVEQDVTTSTPSTPLRESVPEVERTAFGRTVPGLQSRGSITERPTSPTKGMGGFVQSAMMKRTDSVSKRWSNQPAGLGRADSTASLRSGFGSIRTGLAESNSMPRLGQSRSGHESTSRPGSSHGMPNVSSNLATSDSATSEQLTRQAGSMHSRSKSHASLRDNSSQSSGLPPTFSPPLSPSKRWSPTKSSWLESALARPESPTKQMASPSTQPSWMTDLNKAKQQRSSVATTFSHDGIVTDVGPASVQSYQPMKVSTANLEASASKPAIHEDVTSTEKKRTFTPPTKAKPQALAGKPSKEKLLQSSKPELSQHSQGHTATSSPRQPSTPKREEVVATAPTPSSKLSLQSGTIDKPKPATPPKIDFRSTLKARPTSGDQKKSDEPEFRNALGKLKRTTTQNYIAPDVLKNNILRGKAGLAVTDGPQKTVRRDEFKESIVAKKSEMKAKTPEVVARPSQKPLVQAPTLEALEVKKGLQRSSSSNLNAGTPDARRDITPEALAKHKSLRGRPVPPGDKPSKLSEKPAAAPFQATHAPIVESKKGEAVEPVQYQSTTKSTKPNMATEATETHSNAKPTSFADRFNPALAGLLARGPPSQTSVSQSAASTAKDADGKNSAMSLRTSNDAEESKSGELTHMTKGRARGPKRRKPQSSSQAETPKPKSSEPISTTTVPKKSEETDQPQVVPSREPVHPRPKSTAVRTLSMTLSDKAVTKEKPPTPTKSSSLPTRTRDSFESRPDSSHTQLQPVLGSPLMMEEKPKIEAVKQSSANTIANLDGAHGKIAPKSEEDKENSAEVPSVKNAAARWGASSAPKANTSRNTPIKIPSREDEDAAMRSAGLLSSSPLRYRASKPEGLGIVSTSATESPKGIKFPLSPPSSGGGPPKPGKSSRVVSQTLGGGPGVQDGSHIATPTSTAQPVSEATKLLESFFGSVPTISTRLEIDAHTALTAESPAPGRTLRKSIQLLTQNGKLTPLPTDKEYILFSSALYIVTHVSGSTSGQRQTEVFLWVGKDVNGAAVEDAQLFAKRVAKDAANGSRSPPPVLVVRQSRESASFFQALGGIVIIRHGSHAENATKPYMLCGRPHLGHIAFDEVDMTADTLAPVFPYIIVNPVTIQDSQAYLWKGSSCGPEAVGSARLISMDLSSRDVIEVTPGLEPHSLLSLLPSKTITQSKSFPAITERSPPRLFRIDVCPPRRSSSTFFGFFNRRPSSPNPAARPTSSASNRSLTSPSANEDPLTTLTEILPFSQEDFEPEHMYVFDVGSTVLIIPGPLLSTAATQSVKPKDASGVETRMWEHLFAQACLLGNDYAMLAAGLQDRQKVPDVKICLGGLSREVEMCFRDWDERRGLWGAAGLMAGRRSTGGVAEAQTIEVGQVLDCCAR